MANFGKRCTSLQRKSPSHDLQFPQFWWLGDYTGQSWDWDQTILSRIIPGSRLCTVPEDKKIWNFVKLRPPIEEVNDEQSCFHGLRVSLKFRGIIAISSFQSIASISLYCFDWKFQKWKGCTKTSSNVTLHACSWYHFHPDETEDDVMRVYEGTLEQDENKIFGTTN